MRAIPWIGVALLFLAVCGAGGDDSEPGATLSGRPVPLEEVKQVAYFGVISRYNPVVMYEGYQPIMDYLTSQTPYKFELKLGKTYEATVKLLEQGVIQIASLGAVTYLEAHARFGAAPILQTLNKDGEPLYRSLIVVRKDSDLKTLSDLKGRSFCFPSPHSTSGNLFGRYMLEEAGVHLGELARYKNLKHHDQVAKAVLTGKYDAGAVKDVVAYRYEPKGLRILHTSDPIPSEPIVVPSNATPEFIQAVKDALLPLDPENPDHQQVMAGWNEEFRYGFVEATDADYQPIRTMLNAIPERCGDSCHPAHRF